MIPRRPVQIFRSRWSALFWAAGVLFSACSIVGFAPKAPQPGNNAAASAEDAAPADATGEPISNADVAALKQFVDGR